MEKLTSLNLIKARKNSGELSIGPSSSTTPRQLTRYGCPFLAYVNWAIAAVLNTDVYRLMSPRGFMKKNKAMKCEVMYLIFIGLFFFFLIKCLFL